MKEEGFYVEKKDWTEILLDKLHTISWIGSVLAVIYFLIRIGMWFLKMHGRLQ
jgi:hypothetical protein